MKTINLKPIKMEHPIKIDDLGVFPIFGNTHVKVLVYFLSNWEGEPTIRMVFFNIQRFMYGFTPRSGRNPRISGT